MAAQEGAMVKRLHAGRAAQSGLMAALLADRGFTGISDVVEAGYGGFLSSLARTPNMARLLDGLGTDWEAGKVGFKMYPNVTSIHAALDGLRAILVEDDVRAAQIDEIRVGCGHMTFVHTAWDYQPAGTTAAQMNMYYGLSVMAQRRGVAAADYADTAIADPDILSFIPRIKVAVDPEIEERGPAFRHAARICVRTTDGKSLRRDVWHRRGSPENPVSHAEVEEKFAANVDGLLDADAAQRLRSLAAQLDRLADVKAIADIMAGRIQPAA
jgi:2-methylcitrate dehydratase PrpD